MDKPTAILSTALYGIPGLLIGTYGVGALFRPDGLLFAIPALALAYWLIRMAVMFWMVWFYPERYKAEE